jgi:hypothetical protein
MAPLPASAEAVNQQALVPQTRTHWHRACAVDEPRAAVRRVALQSLDQRRTFMSQHPAHSQDQRHPGQPNPVDIQKALSGVDYPTTREKLVECARNNRANTDTVDLIDKLPDQNYDSPTAVSKAIARTQ